MSKAASSWDRPRWASREESLGDWERAEWGWRRRGLPWGWGLEEPDPHQGQEEMFFLLVTRRDLVHALKEEGRGHNFTVPRGWEGKVTG